MPTGCTTATGAMVSAQRCRPAPANTHSSPRSHLGISISFSSPTSVRRLEEAVALGSNVDFTPRCCRVAPLAKRNEEITCSVMARGIPTCVTFHSLTEPQGKH